MMRKHHFWGFLVLTLILLGLAVMQTSSNPVYAGASQEDPLQEDDSCLACHTDKDALVSTAKAEEAVASENEGQG